MRIILIGLMTIVGGSVAYANVDLKTSAYLSSGFEAYDSGNYQKAENFFSAACAADSPEGCSAIGTMHYDGVGVRQNKLKAKDYLDKACTLGDGAGCHLLGIMHYKGEGVKQNNITASWYFGKACRFGNLKGCAQVALQGASGAVSLAGSSSTSEGLKAYRRGDYEEAKQRFTKACDYGNAEGCYSLGTMYHVGDGVPQSNQRAKELYGKACENGSSGGCTEYLKMDN